MMARFAFFGSTVTSRRSRAAAANSSSRILSWTVSPVTTRLPSARRARQSRRSRTPAAAISASAPCWRSWSCAWRRRGIQSRRCANVIARAMAMTSGTRQCSSWVSSPAFSAATTAMPGAARSTAAAGPRAVTARGTAAERAASGTRASRHLLIPDPVRAAASIGTCGAGARAAIGGARLRSRRRRAGRTCRRAAGRSGR